jgi:Rieske Fe-S protein
MFSILYPYYFIRGKLMKPKGSLGDIKPGEGKVIEIDGKKVAVYKKEGGVVVKLSPVCTHMGCQVDWNNEEKCWACPCHGSKFGPSGEVIHGPAEKPLPPVK